MHNQSQNKNKQMIFLFLLIFLFSGCTIEESIKDSKEEQKTVDSTIVSDNEVKTFKNLTKEDKDKIDEWLKDNGYNRYGDSAGVIYTGGTPLFNESTGEQINRFEYILDRHPTLINILN